MKVINLTNTSKFRVDNDVNTLCGGISTKERWINRFANGVGGFSFRDPNHPEDEYVYKVNLAFYVDGLGVYCRNHYANHVVLIPKSELVSLDIVKETSMIKPSKISLYKILLKLGMDPLNAENYLTPSEIIEENLPYLMIKTQDTFFKLEMPSISVGKLNNIFKKSNLADKVALKISSIMEL